MLSGSLNECSSDRLAAFILVVHVYVKTRAGGYENQIHIWSAEAQLK